MCVCADTPMNTSTHTHIEKAPSTAISCSSICHPSKRSSPNEKLCM